MTKYLVTGHCGFIGKALQEELRFNSINEVFGFDIDRYKHEDVRTDVIGEHIEQWRPDVVIHLAAEVGKLNCEQNPIRAMETNVQGTLNVAKACVANGARLVYVSTSEIYGDHGSYEVHESGSTIAEGEPSSGMYAWTKLWGENVATTYALEGLQIIRPTMPYGPGVPPGPGRRALDNLVWQALTGQPMIVHRGASRSWCWIDDMASAIRTVVEKGEHYDGFSSRGVYNVGRDDDEVQMIDLANQIRQLVNSDAGSLIKIVDPPARQTAVKRLSCQKLRDLGWEPKVSLDEGLPKMVAWIKEWEDGQRSAEVSR